MEEEEKKTEEVASEDKSSDKIVRIGEFVTDKQNDEAEESKAGGQSTGSQSSEPAQEAKKVSPDEIKERVAMILSKIASRGLSEEEAKKLEGEFAFWNGLMFEILDIGGNLQSVVGGIHIKLSPMKATLLYAGGTIGLIFLLRPDLLKKKLTKQSIESQPVKVESEEVIPPPEA